MKKVKIFGFAMMLLTIVSLTLFISCNFEIAEATSGGNSSQTFATAEKYNSFSFKQVVQHMFGDKDIEFFEPLYNLDDSADYLYVKFKDGYAIYNKYNMELLEFSPQGDLPYHSDTKKYYAGPSNYLKKIGDEFINFLNSDCIKLSKTEVINYANKIREVFSKNHINTYLQKFENITSKETKSQASPKEDPENLIIPPGATGTYINNAHYFLSAPTHGLNEVGRITGNGNSGTCGPVAAQILLSYENYYNDRRIIEDKYLNGYDDATNTVTNHALNPNYCEDPMDMSSKILGSRSEDTGSNSFYNYVVKTIMKPNTSGSTLLQVKNGLNKVLSQRINNEFSIDKAEKLLNPIDSKVIKQEINAGRPLIISMSSRLGGGNHDVVGYGYQDYTYPNGGTYSGYVVHYGWRNYQNVWVNSSWCDGYITLRTHHVHNYNIYVGGKYNEERCGTCGHRRYAYDTNNLSFNEIEIIGTHRNPSGALVLPNSINGRKLITVGNGVFYNQRNISSVSIPSNVQNIGANTFERCTSINNITFSNSNLKSIGNAAFYGCENLTRITIPSGVVEIGANTFQNCYSLQEVVFNDVSKLKSIGNSAFQDCTNLLSITIPTEVTTIWFNAFLGCSNLTRVAFREGSKLNNIENSAFAQCVKLISFDVPLSLNRIGYDAFSSCVTLESITISNNTTSICGNAFNNCNNLTIYASVESTPNGWLSNWNPSNRPVFWSCNLSSDNRVINLVKSSNNPTNKTAVNGLKNPYKEGYIFDGWYLNSDFTSQQFLDISAAPDGTIYAKWIKNSEPSCVAQGTLITLADGTQKAVEDLTGSELLLVWNMFTGQFDVAPILFIDSDPTRELEVINLHFSDGTIVKVIDEHGFWDFNLNEYVFLRSDAAKYIGHWFNKQTTDANGNFAWTKVQLTNVVVQNEYTSAWSPVTYGHLCYYVNGMLSMPGATTGLINIFDVDPDTMKIDEAAMQADIAKYGLFTYEEFAALYPVPEVIFEAFGGQYLKIAMGKGLLTEEMLESLIERYSGFFEA